MVNLTGDWESLLEDNEVVVMSGALVEPMRSNDRANMPVSRTKNRVRSQRETQGSAKNRARISKSRTGMHKRRQRKIR
ncbi:MAG: hypothetical protein AAF497_06000 [Planctomycetota bacterium]